MRSRRVGHLVDLSWQSLAYGVGIAGRQAAVYVALPFFTGTLTTSEYGVVAVGAAILAFANRLSNAGLPAATFRFFNDSDQRQDQDEALGNAQFLVAAYALATAGIIWLAAEPIAASLLGARDSASVMRLLAVLLLLETVVSYGAVLLRVRVRPLATSMQSLVHLLVQLGLAAMFVHKGYGVMGYWVGHVLGGIIGCSVMLWLVRHDLKFRFARPVMVGLLRYGLPLLPATLALWALRLADRAIIGRIAGLEQVGVYDVGYKVGAIAALIMGPFFTAWPQFSFALMRKPDAPLIYRDVVSLVIAGCTGLTLVTIVFRQEIVAILAPEAYAGASAVVALVALAQIPWCVYPVLVVGLKIAKRTELVAAVTVAAAAMNIALNLLLIPTYGIEGAAAATLAGYFLLSMGSYVLGQRFFAFPLDWFRLASVLAAGVATFGVVEGVAQMYDANVAIRLVLVLVFPVVLVVLRFVPLSTLRELASMVRARRRQHLEGVQ